MAKLPRVTSVLFGSTAPSQTVEEFGSKTQLGTPNYTTDPAQIQQLAAWTDGWTAAIATGNKAPYVQDMNAFCLVDSYQLAYLFQMGIPEWDSATTYYLGSYVQDPAGSGNVWYSLQNNNLNNAPPVGASNAFWKLFTALPPVSTRQTFLSGSGTYTTPANIRQLRIRMVGGGGSGGNPTDLHPVNNGNTTTFNSISAAGGAGGVAGISASIVNGNGGVGGTGGAGSASVRIAGGAGQGGSHSGSFGFGGTGGSSAFGGAGRGTVANPDNNGLAAAANSGGGGGAAHFGDESGGGGGAGEYVEIIINSPAASYSYTVAAASATSVDGSGFGGGAGGSGIIIVDEFY